MVVSTPRVEEYDVMPVVLQLGLVLQIVAASVTHATTT